MNNSSVEKLKSYINQGIVLYFTVYGSSMLPYIKDGDVIKCCYKNEYQKNDIVLFFDGERLVAHIVYNIFIINNSSKKYDIRGVNIKRPFYVDERDVIGFVSHLDQLDH